MALFSILRALKTSAITIADIFCFPSSASFEALFLYSEYYFFHLYSGLIISSISYQGAVNTTLP